MKKLALALAPFVVLATFASACGSDPKPPPAVVRPPAPVETAPPVATTTSAPSKSEKMAVNVDALTLGDRKVGQRNLHIVEFVGTPPAPATGIGTWARLIVSALGPSPLPGDRRRCAYTQLA